MHTELRDPYVLARGTLTTGGDPAGGVRCGRPLIYPVPAADLPLPLRRRAAVSGRRYFGALFAVDVDAPPSGRRHTCVRFTVALTAPGAHLLAMEDVKPAAHQ